MNLPSLLTGRVVPILGNPRSGTGASAELVEELQNSLTSFGLEPRVCWDRDEFSTLVTQLPREQLRCVVAAGGDGTAQEVLNRTQAAHPIALLPLGNENLLARYLQVPRSGRAVAELIHQGQTKVVDLMRLDDRLIVLMASAGFDAAVVQYVHGHRTGHINKWTYIKAIIKLAFRYPFPPIQVELPETQEVLEGSLVFVLNLPQYALDLPIGADAVADDGLLDVVVFRKPGRRRLLRYVWAILRNNHKHLSDCLCRQARTVLLRANQAVPIQADGDASGTTPRTITVVPRALTLVMHPTVK